MAWQDIMPRFKSAWESRSGRSGGRWEEYEPHYRYGWEAAEDPRYSGRRWAEVEPEMRRDWEARYRDQPWDRVSGSVRDAWESYATTDRRAGQPIPAQA